MAAAEQLKEARTKAAKAKEQAEVEREEKRRREDYKGSRTEGICSQRSPTHEDGARIGACRSLHIERGRKSSKSNRACVQSNQKREPREQLSP